MEGKGPYRIYDPGGSRDAALERLVEENAALKERMKGIKSLGELLEESQLEASKLRQRVEDLVKENKVLGSSPPSFLEQRHPQAASAEGCDQILDSFVLPDQDEREQESATKRDPKSPGSGSSSEFEIVPADEKGSSHGSGKSELPNGDCNLTLHLQRLETSLSEFAEQPNQNQLFTHLGRMALEFNRLASKVQKNEQKTSILQTLCEQLRAENEDLRRKLEKDLEQRNRAIDNLRVENMEPKCQVTTGGKDKVKVMKTEKSCEPAASGGEVKLESVQQQSVKLVENVTGKEVLGAMEKKVKALEHQRNELLEVNKQWDKHFRSMKQQYEQKITALRQKLADSQKLAEDLEAEREQKQRDFERKLLLAKSKIETEEGEKGALEAEVKELKQKNRFLQDQLSPVSRQRAYQEKEIQRLNKALEEALNMQASAPPPSVFSTSTEAGVSLRRHEQLMQIDLLKQQVKIFEEDFQRERSDRERMSEEKEDLRHEMQKLQVQITQQSSQLRACMEDLQREKGEKEKLRKLLKQHKQAMAERIPPEHHPGALGPMFPQYQYPYTPPIPRPMYQGFEDWPIHYPPAERPPVQDSRHLPPPEYPYWPPCYSARNPTNQGGQGARASPKESDSSPIATPKNQLPI